MYSLEESTHRNFFNFRLQIAENEISLLNETNVQLKNEKRLIEHEYDELKELLKGKENSNQEERKRLASRIIELQDTIDEEQNKNDIANDTLRRTQIQVIFILCYC